MALLFTLQAVFGHVPALGCYGHVWAVVFVIIGRLEVCLDSRLETKRNCYNRGNVAIATAESAATS